MRHQTAKHDLTAESKPQCCRPHKPPIPSPPRLSLMPSTSYLDRGGVELRDPHTPENKATEQTTFRMEEHHLKSRSSNPHKLVVLFMGILLGFVGWKESNYVSSSRSLYENSDPNPLDRLKTYNNVASLLLDNGDYDGALRVYGRALNLHESIQATDSLETARLHNGVGAALLHKGNYDLALVAHRKALVIQNSRPCNAETATTCNNIGNIHVLRREYGEAVKKYQQATETLLCVHGKDHQETVASFNKVGSVLDKYAGDAVGALKVFVYALHLQLQLHQRGELATATDTAWMYNNIGELLFANALYDTSLDFLQIALKIRESTLGKDHPDTKATLKSIATAFEKNKTLVVITAEDDEHRMTLRKAARFNGEKPWIMGMDEVHV